MQMLWVVESPWRWVCGLVVVRMLLYNLQWLCSKIRIGHTLFGVCRIMCQVYDIDHIQKDGWITKHGRHGWVNQERLRINYVERRELCSVTIAPHAFKMNMLPHCWLRSIRKFGKFPTQATDLVQSADVFVIQKINDAWWWLWYEYKFEQIQKENWKNGSNGD